MVKILFLAANPADTSRLRLDEEIRAIDQALRQTDFRDQFVIERHGAVHIDDLQSLLLRYKPEIVHFSGHGSAVAEIILQDEQGNSRPVSGPALQRLFALLKENITCVVLNACYSELQAQAIAEEIACVIGMSGAIGDESAIKFAVAFYQALGYGKDVQTAFQLGRAQIDLANLGEQDNPQLLASMVNPARITFVSSSVAQHQINPLPEKSSVQFSPPLKASIDDGRNSLFIIGLVVIGAIVIFSSGINFPFFGSKGANGGEPQTTIPPTQATTTSQPATLPSAASTASPPVTIEPPTATTLPTKEPSTNLTPATATPLNTQTIQNNACPEMIDFGNLIHCELAVPGKIRIHSFQTTQDDQVYIKVINEEPDGQMSPLLTILDPNDDQLFEGGTHHGVERVILAPSSGTYTIRIQDVHNAYTGKYAMYLQHPAQAQTIPVGQQLITSINASFQHDAYVFVATAGEEVVIEVSETQWSGPLGLGVIVYGPDGKQADGDLNSSSVTLKFTASSSGTYLMIVHDQEYNDTGEYSVFRSR